MNAGVKRGLGFIVAVAVVALLTAGQASATPADNGYLYGAVVGAPQWGSGAPGYLSKVTEPGSSVAISNVCTGVYRVRIDSVSMTDPASASYALGTYITSHGVLPYVMDTFCIDVRQNANSSPIRYEFYKPEDAPIGGANVAMQGTKATDLRKLVENYWFGGDPYTAWTNATAAAFQAAVWEIVTEAPANPYDLYAGQLKVVAQGGWSTGATSDAQQWLDSLEDLDAPTRDVWVLASETSQDYAIWFPSVSHEPPPVPEPVTMAGLAMGIGGLAAYVRRRRIWME